MQVQKPTFKNELNLTTVVMAVGLVATLGGWIWQASGTNTRIEARLDKFDAYVLEHAQLHKDRNVAISADAARTDQRFIAVETMGRKVDQLEYRVTVQEQGSVNLTRSVEELKSNVSTLTADTRVILEILKRMDGGAPKLGK